MDIQKIISDLVSKLTGNNDLIKKFTSNPAALIKDLLGLEVDAEQLKAIVAGVTSKLGISAADAVKEGKSFLDKIKSFFGK